MISRPERDLVNTGVKSAGLVLVVSPSGVFFGTAFLLPLAGGTFAIMGGVSAEGVAGRTGSGTSGSADEGVGVLGIGSSFGKFAGYLAGTCSWGRCCELVVQRGLMSCLLRLSLLLLLSLMIQYESRVVSLDSVYPGFHSSNLSSVNHIVWFGR